MRLSPTNDRYIKEVLKSALTDDINDREVFMKGIDQSYAYEEAEGVSIFELDRNENN